MSLHAPPCVFVLPLIAIPVMVVLMPVWAVALVLVGVIWLLVWPFDLIARRGGGGKSAARTVVERWLYWLTHPKWPEKWTRK